MIRVFPQPPPRRKVIELDDQPAVASQRLHHRSLLIGAEPQSAELAASPPPCTLAAYLLPTALQDLAVRALGLLLRTDA